MRPEEFAANRGARLTKFDDELRPVVDAALKEWSSSTAWYDGIVEGASVLWTEMFEESAPNVGEAQRDRLLEAFQHELRRTLARTHNPADANKNQAQLITEWVSTATSNHAELRAGRSNGHPQFMWITREDSHVRATHQPLDRTTVPAGQTFSVGGYHLAYPGEPVGPPSIWIACRCILQRMGKGKSMAGDVTAFTEDDVITAAAVETDDPDAPVNMTDLTDDDLVDSANAPVPFHGVAAPTDTPSGDGRLLKKSGASFRQLPLPLLWQRQSADGHSQSTVVGRIDNMSLDDDTGNVVYDGQFNTTPEASEAIQGVAEGWLRGVSVDVDMAEMDLDGDGDSPLATFSSWRIAGVTMVAIPAFEQAFIALGPTDDDPNPQVDDGSETGDVDQFRKYTDGERKDAADKGHALPDGSFPINNVSDLRNAIQAVGLAKDKARARTHIKKRAKALGHSEMIPDGWAVETEEFAPGTEDGPGWVTNHVPTARLRRYWVHGAGAAKIGWNSPNDFYRCREHLGKYVSAAYLNGTCANLHKEATGAWPGHAPGDKLSLVAAGARMAAAVNLVAAAAPMVPPGDWFQDPKLSAPTPFTVMDDGRVFGHVATFDTCHIGYDKVCTTAPHSVANYAYYRTGEIDTTLGPVMVGQVTMGAGHADMRAGAQAAAAHYDNVAHAVADVAAGEDQYGIWIAGALRPGLLDDEVRTLRAASLSGDWRRIRGHMEMVAALAVNVPGFPIPRNALAASGTEQLSLVAAGVVEESAPDLVGDFDGRVASAVERVLAQRDRAAKVRSRAYEAARRVRIKNARRMAK